MQKQGELKEQHSIQTIVLKKEREEEYDQDISKQWKEARSTFFNQTIKQRLNQAKIKQQIEITQLFMQAQQNESPRELCIHLTKKGYLCEYRRQIVQLKRQFVLINQQFSLRQKETPAITQIIQLKLTGLRVIKIQYSLNIYQKHQYQVSAFVLFKVVHANRELLQVTLKGVLVKEFHYFISTLPKLKSNQLQENKSKEWSWMKDFKPSKQLKILIDIQDEIRLTGNDNLGVVKDLVQFGGMFSQLGLISVRIDFHRSFRMFKLGWAQNPLKWLFSQLAMERIKIKVRLQGEYAYDCPTELFTEILQMLSSLTTVAQLQFQQIRFDSKQIGINHFLAMEQIFHTIFEKNAVTHLKLYDCFSFPILPAITSLQKIWLYKTNFRRQFSIMSELARSSPSLQSITYSLMHQEWIIEEQLFNQLQRLQISHCKNLILSASTQFPSKIRYLTIYNSNIGNVDVLFSKLANITSLFLYSIDIGHQLICTIPSPHLAELVIQLNSEFADQDLEMIDKKWPKLRQLTLRNCPKLKESGWSACEFKGLTRLWIETKLLARGHPIRRQLRGRGIMVYQKQY